jgi:hypothetical protein
MHFRVPGASVRVDDYGIDVRQPPRGTRAAWAAISGLRIITAGDGGAPRRAVTVSLIDGSALILPAPRERPGRAAAFDTASRAIVEAHRSHTVPADEPSDEVPPQYRVGPEQLIEHYFAPSAWRGGRLLGGLAYGLPRGGPNAARPAVARPRLLRPGLLLLAVVFIGPAIGLGGSIHALVRDRPAYDAFRSPAACSAYDAASGLIPGGYCRVTDGQVDSIVTDARGNIDSLIVGPIPQDIPDPNDPSITLEGGDWVDGPTQFAVFGAGQPGLELSEGEPVDYLSQQSGDVASVTVGGVTYQTYDSPQLQNVYDVASICAFSAAMLLFGLWFAFRVRRHRYTAPRVFVLLTCLAAFLVGGITAGTASGDQGVTTAGTVFLLLGAIAPGSAALATAILWLMLRRRARLLLYRRHRAPI